MRQCLNELPLQIREGVHIMIAMLILVLAFVLLDMAAMRWGVDST